MPREGGISFLTITKDFIMNKIRQLACRAFLAQIRNKDSRKNIFFEETELTINQKIFF